MEKMKTVDEIAKIFNVRPQTIRTYVDGYKLAKYRVNNYTIIYNDESKKIIVELLSRSRRTKSKPKKDKAISKYDRLQSEIDFLKKQLLEVTNGKR